MRRDDLDDLAGSVLDGTPVDWARAEEGADAASRAVLKHLRVLKSVADAHRSPEAWGHLRLLERIGSGAFGDVYRAWDTRLDREVALKLLLVNPAASHTPTTAIIREGRLLARVRHPNVVTIHGAEQIGDRVGLWMELVRGRTLEQLLQEGTEFTPGEAARIGLELARALRAVHEAGLLHRDVKAQNVMREDGGRVVLMDFGTGREAAEAGGDLTGTPLYLAPEVFRGTEATPRSDIYSAGVVLFHVLTRSYPVRGGSVADLRRAHETGTRVSVRELRPDMPWRLAEIIDRAIDPDPAARYESASALGAALESMRGRGRRSWVAAASMAAAVAAAAAWSLWPHADPVIGILPFQNLGTEAGGDLVADGLTVELTSLLAGVEGLDVRTAVSSLASRDTARDIAAAGRQLGADFVLDAAIVASGTPLRVDARLVRLSDGETVWSDSIVGSQMEPRAVQDDLARGIVSGLRLPFSGRERRYDIDLDLYYQFLQARGLQLRRRPEYAAQAVEIFERVVARAPSFAPAWAGLARSLDDMWRLNQAADLGQIDPRSADAAVTALRLDAAFAEAHAVSGIVFARAGDWDNAEAAFERALQLDPSLTSTHTDYVLTTLLPLGRNDEALAMLERARKTDPFSLDVRRILALVQVESGLYDEAIENSGWVLARDPAFPYADIWLGRALVLSGRPLEALPIFEGNPRHWGYLGYLYAVIGRRDEAEALAAAHPEGPPQQMLIYGGLGDKERAFDALERTVAANPWWAATWMLRPEVALLRDDPRFAAIRKQLGVID